MMDFCSYHMVFHTFKKDSTVQNKVRKDITKKMSESLFTDTIILWITIYYFRLYQGRW